jgi:hypothetical protein
VAAREADWHKLDGERSVEVDDRVEKVSEVLHRAGETHHTVFGIVDGVDEDWASWYSDWLVKLSELPDLLGTKPVRSELTYKLVQLDKEYTQQRPDERWEDHYARGLLEHFAHSS